MHIDCKYCGWDMEAHQRNTSDQFLLGPTIYMKKGSCQKSLTDCPESHPEQKKKEAQTT